MSWSWTGQKKYIFYAHLRVSLQVGNYKQKEPSISVCFCDSRMKKQLVWKLLFMYVTKFLKRVSNSATIISNKADQKDRILFGFSLRVQISKMHFDRLDPFPNTQFTQFGNRWVYNGIFYNTSTQVILEIPYLYKICIIILFPKFPPFKVK